MTLRERVELDRLILNRPNPLEVYCPHVPFPNQAALLADDSYEILYGGAVGGGKSETLLMDAIQWVDVPEYACLILRRTYADLAQPGAIMDRAKSWLMNRPGVHWSEQNKIFTFPSGAKIQFGYLESENDKYRYQSSEFQRIYFDELTQFAESQYTYLHSRVRGSVTNFVPRAMRAGSNPGGVGHKWVKKRFLDAPKDDTKFIPSKLDDNPYIDHETYLRSLSMMLEEDQMRLRDGVWDDIEDLELFKDWMFEGHLIDPSQCPEVKQWYRGWDTATSAKQTADDSATLKAAFTPEGDLILRGFRHAKLNPRDLNEWAEKIIHEDGPSVLQIFEKHNMGYGIFSFMQRQPAFERSLVLQDITGAQGDKRQRATPMAVKAKDRKVYFVKEGEWQTAYRQFLDFTGIKDRNEADHYVDAGSVVTTYIKEQSSNYEDETTYVSPRARLNQYFASGSSRLPRSKGIRSI